MSDVTVERRLYFTLKHATGPLGWADIRLRSRLDRYVIYDGMDRLVDKGLVESLGHQKLRTFWLKVGAVEPVDMRGTSVNSLKNLSNVGSRAGRVYRKKPTAPTPTHALEQCWGWVPSFPNLQETQE